MEAPPTPPTQPQEITPKIAIEIQPVTSILNGCKLIEYFGKNQRNKLLKLMQSKLLTDKWDEKNYSQELSARLWKNERHALENYYKNYNKKIDGFIVKYSRHKQKFGRVYPLKSLGLTSMPKTTRNTLIKGIYYDFDLSNAQPSILLNICEQNEIDCDNIKNYCENQAKIKKELAETLGCAEECIKKLFIRMAFLGSYKNWAEEFKIDKPCPNIVENYAKELRMITNIIKSKNPELYKIVFDQKTEKEEGNIMGSFLSKYLQEYEIRIVESVLEWLFNETEICNSSDPFLKIATYEFDGIKILSERVDKWGSIGDFIAKLEEITLKKTGFKVKWVNKPIEKVYDIKFTTAPSFSNNSYESVKMEWEEKHCKILDAGEYIERNGNEIIIRSRKNLFDSYEHICCGVDDEGKNISFLPIWLKDPNILTYKTRECYPNKLKCPDDVFNTWLDFEMENICEWEHKEEELKFILNHIKILCGHDEEIYNYFIMWLAHMIQYPHIKSICPTLISTEGAGKTTLIDLMSNVMGSKKVLMTSSPEKDIWGQFNPLMMNAFLVNLNEVNLGNSYNAENRIKELITDKTVSINNKGVNAFTIKSYHRFIATTNSPDGFFRTTKKDRRNLVIRSSDELVNNFEYFKKINSMIDDVNVCKTFYEYLKNLENVPEKIETPPKSDYQKTLFEMNETPIEQFIRSITADFMHKRHKENPLMKTPHIEELFPAEIFKEFQKWLVENKMKNDYNSIRFGVALKNLNIPGIDKGRHTSSGTSKIFNIDILKNFYNLENIEFLDDN